MQQISLRSHLDGIVTMRPLLTLHFGRMHAITRNKLKKSVDTLVGDYAWDSKAGRIMYAMRSRLPIERDIIPPDFLATLPKHELDELDTKLNMFLLRIADYRPNGGRLQIIDVPTPIHDGQTWDSVWEQRRKGFKLVTKLLEGRIRAWSYDRLTPEQRQFRLDVLDAIEQRASFTFEGALDNG